MKFHPLSYIMYNIYKGRANIWICIYVLGIGVEANTRIRSDFG